MNFHVGMKVVCVDDEDASPHLSKYPWRHEIIKGQIYVIRWTGFYQLRYGRMGKRIVGVRLAGIVRPRKDTPFLASRFRPVKTTDISIFTKMLAPTPKEREPA